MRVVVLLFKPSLLILITCLMFGCKTIQIGEADLLRPDRGVEAAARTSGQKVERFSVPTEHGVIAVTRISKPGNRTALLYCGGNQFRTSVFGGDIVSSFPAEVDLILFDYPGYGESTGPSTVAGLMASTLSVYDQVMATSQTSIQRRVVYGSSMGGLVAAHVAGARNPHLLVLEGTAPDTQRWAKSFVPWFAKPFIKVGVSPALAAINSVDELRGFSGRALLLVGSRDSQTKPALMRYMKEALQKQQMDVRFEVVEGRGHGEVLGHPAARKVIAEFLQLPSLAMVSP